MTERDLYNFCVWLPNREQLDICVRVKATGQELFEKVCERLNIKEAHFFGLSIVKNNEYIFIDLEQKLNKYFSMEWKKEGTKTTEKFSPPCVAFFRVQYYVENGRIISDKKARMLYYYHLKERVLYSHCYHKEEVYFLLAAYALQADFGSQQTANSCSYNCYFEPESYFPHWIIAKRGRDYILKHVPEMHKEQKGISVKKAVLNFIKDSCLLEDVPVHYFRLQKDKEEDQSSIILGITVQGMHIYQKVDHVHQLLYDFLWSDVGKITFHGKKFEIQSDRLHSTGKLVYYTGSPFRSQHLLQLLSNSHRLYLNIKPVQNKIKKLEEIEEKNHYHESYISVNMEMDFDHSEKIFNGSREGSTKNSQDSVQSGTSQSNSCTSGLDSLHIISEEMSVDEPTFSCSCGIYGSKGNVQRDFQDYEEIEMSVDNTHQFPVIGTLTTNAIILESEEVSVDSPTFDKHSWHG